MIAQMNQFSVQVTVLYLISFGGVWVCILCEVTEERFLHTRAVLVTPPFVFEATT